MSELGFDSRAEYGQLRDLLHQRDFSFDAVSKTLETEDWLTPQMIDLPRYGRMLRDGTPQHVLIQLFLMGAPVPESQVRESIRPMSLEQWVQAGLLAPPNQDGFVSARIRMTPLDDRLFVSDCPKVTMAQAREDFVMGPSGTSLQLGWSAVTRRVSRSLDLGTGSGYLALKLADFSDTVIASDRNARATMMTQFNILLNDCDHVTARTGDLLQPVENERFGLVVCNPPFVITPEAKIMLRDSGVRGDEFCRNLIRAMPPYLEEGGYFQMLGNFGYRRQDAWREQLAEWFDDLGCDAIVLVPQIERADEYAMHWITTTESQEQASVNRLFDEWMDYYEANGIDTVAYISVYMRRRSSGANWVYVDTDEVRILGACGDEIEQRFAALDFVDRMSDDRVLLQQRVTLNPLARIVQEHVMTDEGPRLSANRLELRGHLKCAANLDANVIRMVVECDGRQTLQAVFSDLATRLGLETAGVEQVGLPVVRHLVERGFLQPCSSPG